MVAAQLASDTAHDTMLAGGGPMHGAAMALRSLWSLVWREARTLTYADSFLAIALCFAIATAMVPLMRRASPAPGPSAHAH